MEKKNKKNQKNRKEIGGMEYEQRILDLARVTRVMAGGKRMRFRAAVAVGDQNGMIGVGVAKGADVTLAVNKAVHGAKKNMVKVPILKGTIPHVVKSKYGAARILLKPAPMGTGVKAGGVLRLIIQVSGIPNVVGKILGSNNKINNARAFIKAVESFLPRSSKRASKV